LGKPRIKVALAGVGNCASALIQGIQFYQRFRDEEESIGLRRLYLGGYHPRDIEFVCAFDIAECKVGKDLSEAIFCPPNNTTRICEVPPLNVTVMKGPVLDGVNGIIRDIVKVSTSKEVNVAEELERSGAEMLINLLPSGSVKASEKYCEEALKAGCAFINATPTFIATDPSWIEKFRLAGLPLVGDDLVDQVGATIIHKVLLETLTRRGVRISETYQLDVGGGTESLNTLMRARDVKRIVKTASVGSVLPYKANVVAGSTDYVDFLGNRRDSYFWLKGLYFGGVEMRLDIRLSTVDGPNAGSVLLDVIRAVKIALVKGIAGHVLEISAYAFKKPLKILPPLEAEERFESLVGE